MSKETLGFNWYMDQNISSQTNKVLAGTPVYTTTGTSSAVKTSGWADNGTLQTSGWTNSAAVLNVGDVFSIAQRVHGQPAGSPGGGPSCATSR
jgi:hypothetical protein